MSDGGDVKRARQGASTEEGGGSPRRRGGSSPACSSPSSSSDGSIPDALEAARAQPPAPPPPEKGGPSFSFEELEKEVEALRADPPAYVSSIGRLVRPPVICGAGGDVINVADSGDEGPWDLSMCIAGEDGDKAYGDPNRINLRFDVDLWPMKLALIAFRGVFHHALTDDSGGMLMPFYRALPRDERGACTVRSVVDTIHCFLADPLKAWKVPPEKAPRDFFKSIAGHRSMQIDRKKIIDKYSQQVLHQDFFRVPMIFPDGWLDPAFLHAVREDTPAAWRAILTEHLPGEVFSFRIFTDEFCDRFVAEMFNFYATGLPVRRPNSMNNYGIVLNDIGLEPFAFELQRLLQPLGAILFPGSGDVWDGQHCFIVRYKAEEDLGLDMHTDDSDVTANVCLGLEFTAAHLQFCGVMGAPDHRRHTYSYEHKKGKCVMHLGRKRHGADDIESGERLNLILWNHSSTYRSSDAYKKPPYKTESAPPDKICVSYTHDRDFGIFNEYPKGKEKFKGRGWCPRPTYEYSGFVPDVEKERADSDKE